MPRRSPEDFWEGARLHERYRWPISYSDVAPYYTYAEQLLEVVGGAPRHPPALYAGGARPGAPPARGMASVGRRSRALWPGPGVRAVGGWSELDGPPPGNALNSLAGIVSRLRRFRHFELRLGAHAQRLTWNDALARVDGVEYVDRDTGAQQHLAASAVIVAAGPLASPKLLLQSVSRDFPAGLGTAGRSRALSSTPPKDWCVLVLTGACRDSTSRCISAVRRTPSQRRSWAPR